MRWFDRLFARWRRPVELPNPLDFQPVDLVSPYTVVYGQSTPLRPYVRPAEPERPGIKPPDEFTWDEWSRGAAAVQRPGWAHVRFANRTRKDEAAIVFGWVNRYFGMYLAPGEVHVVAPMRLYQDRVLACITHLPTGVGIGVFEEIDVALDAAELAMRVTDRWDAIDPTDRATWQADFERLRAAWEGVDIHHISNGHAVIQGDRCMLFQRQPHLRERPERLS